MTDQVDQDVELDEEIEEAHDPKNAEAQRLHLLMQLKRKALKRQNARVIRATANRLN